MGRKQKKHLCIPLFTHAASSVLVCFSFPSPIHIFLLTLHSLLLLRSITNHFGSSTFLFLRTFPKIMRHYVTLFFFQYNSFVVRSFSEYLFGSSYSSVKYVFHCVQKSSSLCHRWDRWVFEGCVYQKLFELVIPLLSVFYPYGRWSPME